MIHEHHLEVTRTARFFTLGSPAPGVRQLWLACHGYGQLAFDFLGGLRALAAPDRLVVAPEALSRFYVEEAPGPHGPESRVGASWMTREDRLLEIDDQVAYLDRLRAHVRAAAIAGARGAEPPRTVALGFSQGAPAIARWAARTSGPPDELVLWGARLPPELDPAEVAGRWRRLRATLVVGTRDRWLPESSLHEDAARLRQHGVATRLLTFEGGHRLDDATLLAIAAGAAEEPDERVRRMNGPP